MEKYCYTTLLATDNYLYGVVSLYYSLKMSEAKYPLIVLVTDNIKKENIDILDEIGIEYRIVPETNFAIKEDEHIEIRKRYTSTFNKFHMLKLIEYEKILFLDADLIITDNIDKVFQKNCPAFWILNKTFISGTFILMSPSEELFNYFLSIKDNYFTDESIINEYYGETKKQNFLEIIFKRSYHQSHNEIGENKYWEILDFKTAEQAKDFIEKVYSGEIDDIPWYLDNFDNKEIF